MERIDRKDKRQIFEEVGTLKAKHQSLLMREIVTGRSGSHYLVTGITKQGLSAREIDNFIGDKPQEVTLPNDAWVTFANRKSIFTRYPNRIKEILEDLINKSPEEAKIE